MAGTTQGDIPLSELRPGDLGRVCQVSESSALERRLLDLGFLPETPVRMIRRAPLGDPIEFEIRGTRICLRREEAGHIRVRLGESP
ncbi:MAG: FeoA family protein [Myxococcota bacterium]